MVLLWLIKVTSISLKHTFYKLPHQQIWLGIIRDYLVTLYSLYHSQVEITLALTESTVSSYLSKKTAFLRLIAFVQCNVRVTSVKLYPKFLQFTLHTMASKVL